MRDETVALDDALRSVYNSVRREDRLALVHDTHSSYAPNLVLGFGLVCLFLPILIPIASIYLNHLFGKPNMQSKVASGANKLEDEAPVETFYLAQVLEDELNMMLKEAEQHAKENAQSSDKDAKKQ